MRLRSLLYVPAHSERFIAKAHERGADAIILDLEDAVPEADKDCGARRAGRPPSPAVGRNGAARLRSHQCRAAPAGGRARPPAAPGRMACSIAQGR